MVMRHVFGVLISCYILHVSRCIIQAVAQICPQSNNRNNKYYNNDDLYSYHNYNYDIVIMFVKRDNENYICQTLNAITKYANYTDIYLSYSGPKTKSNNNTENNNGNDLFSMYPVCPELRSITTSTFSAKKLWRSKMAAKRLMKHYKNEINTDNNNQDHYTESLFLKMMHEKINYSHAFQISSIYNNNSNDGLPLLVLEDDVIIAPDFDVKIRCAMRELHLNDNRHNDIRKFGQLDFIINIYNPAEGLKETRIQSNINNDDDDNNKNKNRRKLSQYHANHSLKDVKDNETIDTFSSSLIVENFYFGSQGFLFSSKTKKAFSSYIANRVEVELRPDYNKFYNRFLHVIELPDMIVKNWADIQNDKKRENKNSNKNNTINKPRIPIYSFYKSLSQHIGKDSKLFSTTISSFRSSSSAGIAAAPAASKSNQSVNDNSTNSNAMILNYRFHSAAETDFSMQHYNFPGKYDQAETFMNIQHFE